MKIGDAVIYNGKRGWFPVGKSELGVGVIISIYDRYGVDNARILWSNCTVGFASLSMLQLVSQN